MLNYLKKFAIEIVPSVAATVIGAYIVNHYINAKPASETPKAAVVSTAQPKSDTAKPDTVETASIPAAGVKAKGISEKALLEKNAASEKAVVVEKAQDKPAEKATDKPAETTASLPAEARRPAPVRAAKAAPVPSPAQPVIAAAPADAAAGVEDRRDANDLARAAIDRLRANNGETPRAQPAPRAPEVAHVPEEPRGITAPPPALRPLPPPIVVSEPADPAASRVDPSRPTPPADIPTARPPLDLRAEAVAEPPKQKTNVAEDVLSAAKSMFHAVLPKPRTD
ncbi:MAG: hypothetical protein U1E61_22100 [Bradyrhizobium sp.]